MNQQVLKRQAIAYWANEARNRPVKLTSVLRQPTLWAEGYVTCWKFVAGRTLAEAERMLGLKENELQGGAYRYEFSRLPREDEFDLRGYTQCPDGEVWTPKSEYPAGLGAPQWCIRRDAAIPSRLVAVVQPGQVIP
jgi:hypothetical protein